MKNLAPGEATIYLGEHPANSLYYVGSALVFRTLFASIADRAGATSGLSHSERVDKGWHIVRTDLQEANWHMHVVLYGLIKTILERALGRPLDVEELEVINVEGAPRFDKIPLPSMIEIGPKDDGGGERELR